MENNCDNPHHWVGPVGRALLWGVLNKVPAKNYCKVALQSMVPQAITHLRALIAEFTPGEQAILQEVLRKMELGVFRSTFSGPVIGQALMALLFVNDEGVQRHTSRAMAIIGPDMTALLVETALKDLRKSAYSLRLLEAAEALAQPDSDTVADTLSAYSRTKNERIARQLGRLLDAWGQ